MLFEKYYFEMYLDIFLKKIKYPLLEKRFFFIDFEEN